VRCVRQSEAIKFGVCVRQFELTQSSLPTTIIYCMYCLLFDEISRVLFIPLKFHLNKSDNLAKVEHACFLAHSCI